MEEDEEVILQNSPLDAYLQEVTDSEFSKYQSINENNIFLETTTEEKPQHEPLQSDHVFERNFHGNHEISKICEILFDSNLLTPDDHSLLIELKDDITEQSRFLDSAHTKLDTKTNVMFTNNMFASAAFFVIIGIIARFTAFDTSTVLFLLFSLLIILVTVWRFWQSIGKQNPASRQNDVTSFIEKMHHVDKLIDQSVTHIKEVEVINGGFQMFRKPITKELPGRKTNKCLKLRSVLLDLLIDLFMEVRVSERMLLQTYSDELFSVKEEFLATIPLEKFNEIISTDKSTNRLQLSNISLDKLKALVYLYRVLLSEFTLVLIVCFHSNVLNGGQFSDLLHSIEQVVASSDNQITNLEHSLSKSRKLTFRKGNENEAKNYSQNVKDPVDELFKKCRLNLYSSLSRLEEVELLIRENKTSLDIVTFENLSLQFGMNIDNAKACIEDITDIFKPKESNQRNKENTEEINKRDENIEPVISTVIPEREMGDLMYEGESLEATLRTLDAVNIEDLEQHLKESRESKRLLRELKSIFAVKDSPVGLLSFPLTKASDAENNEELKTDDVDDLFMLRKKKRGIITGDEDFYGEGEENPDSSKYIPSAPIGLPVNLLQGLPTFSSQCEEKFGSSDDDDDDNDNDNST